MFEVYWTSYHHKIPPKRLSFKGMNKITYTLNDYKLKVLGWNPKKIFEEEMKGIVNHHKNNIIKL
jgi:hypothetical protein